MKRLVIFILSIICMSSCLPATVGVVGYKMSQNRTQNAYREYVADTQKENQKRRDQGLEPMPVMTFEEWKRLN